MGYYWGEILWWKRVVGEIHYLLGEYGESLFKRGKILEGYHDVGWQWQ